MLVVSLPLRQEEAWCRMYSSFNQHFPALSGFSLYWLSFSASRELKDVYSCYLWGCIAPVSWSMFDPPRGKGSRQQIAGITLIQNQQDSSVTEVHKSWNCYFAKTPSFLLFWLDCHPFPFIFYMLLTLPKPVIGIVLLSSLCNYSIQQMFWEHATGVALPARVMWMCLWYRSTEHSLIRGCLLRAEPKSLVLHYYTRSKLIPSVYACIGIAAH